MSTGTEFRSSSISHSRRNLFLRDTLIFLGLTLVSLVLYGLTLALFRSFESHRADLAIYWSHRAKDELAHGRPDEAAASLRNAISFAPDDRQYELLLAEALAESGKTDQAMSYFMNLREVRPGDGFINLEIARLYRKKELTAQAVDYYHAAIFGDWRGDGTARRRSIRLELAEYLASIHEMAAARTELLIASANASNDPTVTMLLGNKFAALGDDGDALNAYKQVLHVDPDQPAALEAAGRISLQMGNYEAAHAFLGKAAQEPIQNKERKEQVLSLAEEAGRLEQLSISPNLPNRERAEHLFAAKSIAQKRFQACYDHLEEEIQATESIEDLAPRWKAAEHTTLRRLQDDEGLQESTLSLIDDTESITAKLCGAPTGDNAILLKLASHRPTNQ
jgi:tetratricopeptide (TPR) repeat protein